MLSLNEDFFLSFSKEQREHLSLFQTESVGDNVIVTENDDSWLLASVVSGSRPSAVQMLGASSLRVPARARCCLLVCGPAQLTHAVMVEAQRRPEGWEIVPLSYTL